MLGVWANAVHIPKRAVSTLNRCGFLVSYDTTRKGLRAVAKHDREILCAKIRDGQPFGIFWDNLVRTDKKEEETLTNRRSLEQNTSAYVHFLHLPEPPEDCPELVEAYRNVAAAIEDEKEVEADVRVGLPRSLLYQSFEHGMSLQNIDKRDFLFDDLLANHIRVIAGIRIGEVLQKIYGMDALKVFEQDGKKLDLPRLPGNYPRLEPHRSDLHCLPTMGLDETTIDGTAMVLEEIIEYCGVGLDKLSEGARCILASGDQMSNSQTRKLQELRIRDDIRERHECAIPKPGPLHISMAFLGGFFRCHMTGKSGKDATSLARFAAMLARTRLSDDGKITDFNAANCFVTQAWEAHVLAAAVEQSGVTSLDELGQWIKENNWVNLITSIVKIYFPTEKVAYQREMAVRKARDEYVKIRKMVLDVAPRNRTAAQKEFLGMHVWLNFRLSKKYLILGCRCQSSQQIHPNESDQVPKCRLRECTAFAAARISTYRYLPINERRQLRQL